MSKLIKTALAAATTLLFAAPVSAERLCTKDFCFSPNLTPANLVELRGGCLKPSYLTYRDGAFVCVAGSGKTPVAFDYRLYCEAGSKLVYADGKFRCRGY